MAGEITSGLFGLDPWQIQQQQAAREETMSNQAFNVAGGTPGQIAARSFSQMGAGLGNIAGGMMGGVNPEMAAAQRTQSVLGSSDLNTPNGMREAAKRLHASGDIKRAFLLNQLANQKEADELKARQEAELKTSQMAENLAQAEKYKQEPTTKGEYQEVGVKGRPAWRQRVRINPDGSVTIIGEPYESSAGISADTRALIASQKSSQAGTSPPKNLTREARLRWELENGLIDQATYDAAISATPGSKLKTEKIASANIAESGFKAVERNIDALYDEQTQSLKPAAKPLFGKFAQYTPELVQSQQTVDANAALESLTNQVMMANLSEAKERVGQSFGSMQVQEWDKFTQQLTSLKRGLSEAAAAKAMKYVKDFIANKRAVLNVAMGADKPSVAQGQPETTAPARRIVKFGDLP